MSIFIAPLFYVEFWVIYSSFVSRGFLKTYFFKQLYSDTSFMMLSAIWFGCLLHLVWTLLFMDWGVFQWHFAAYIPILVILGTIAINSVFIRLQNCNIAKYSIVMLIFTIMISYNFFIYLEKSTHHLIRYEAALWARDHTQPDTAFALSDAGAFGYFSNRPTINLDGLINSYEFQDSIINDTLRQFLKNENVCYIADAHTTYNYQTRSINIVAYRGKNRKIPVGYRILASKSDEIYSSRPEIYRPLTLKRKICFAIWDFDKVNISRILN